MEELDLLKKDWNKTASNFKQVSEAELYKMLHKNSSSIVKWILILSICEILLWTILNIYNSTDDFLKSIKHPEFKVYFNLLSIFIYIISIGFIVQFYRNYRKISTLASTRKLMRTILKTRKTVRIYVVYNLLMIVFQFLIGVYLAFNYNPEMLEVKDKIVQQPSTMVGVVVGVLLATIILIGAFWLFYRLVYGVLTKKLYQNYNELKNIDF